MLTVVLLAVTLCWSARLQPRKTKQMHQIEKVRGPRNLRAVPPPPRCPAVPRSLCAAGFLQSVTKRAERRFTYAWGRDADFGCPPHPGRRFLGFERRRKGSGCTYGVVADVVRYLGVVEIVRVVLILHELTCDPPRDASAGRTGSRS